MPNIIARLIRIARAVLHQQQNIIATQVIQAVEDQIMKRFEAHIREVVGGVWVGKGADAFVNVIRSDGMTMTNQIIDDVSTMGNNLQRANDIMDEADNTARGLVNNLEDTFSSIY